MSAELNHDFKDTLNLPQTEFPMRANAKEREPQIQAFWQKEKIYETCAQANPLSIFTLHDGPPYANGSLHIGHALNKILKDIINRYHLLKGHKVRFVLGWDCHGLPIELKVLQNLSGEERKRLTPLAIRQRAKQFALETIQEQAQGFSRWGIWGDYEHAYYTLSPKYEAAQIGVFGQMALKGYIYRGLKPVYWSPSSQTALAEAELEYPEGHTSPSIYVAFPVQELNQALQGVNRDNLYVMIWTTTPWTIPANLGICANAHLSYAIVRSGERRFIVASELVSKLADILGMELTIEASFLGEKLEHIICRHPLYDRPSPLIFGDHVTAESGTGLVHTAPAHGQDDFTVGRKYHLGMVCPVDDYGVFTEAAAGFAGLAVLKEGNRAVIQALQERGYLLKEVPYVHKYPYDWRTKKPVIVRATEQWFASVDGFRELALQAIKQVEWIPASGENRITAMVQERSDWCISRQRSWGVPIPVFYHKETGEVLLNQETITHIQQLIHDRGSDAWWELSEKELLPPAYKEQADQYRKGTDTMDVWFDSGSSWAAVLKGELAPYPLNFPADMYLEGSDQHRGWFQSSLLTCTAVHGHAPYKTVLTHGFIVDEQGRKMSKSLGNGIDPMDVINGGKDQKQEPAYGADVLRLWVASVDYAGDVPLGKNILNQIADVSRKIRNTARFLLSNLYDFQPQVHLVPYAQLPELDKYALHRLYEVVKEVTEAYDRFQFAHFFQVIQNFCAVDLSSFYLDIAKDRLYISHANSPRRRSCQTVLYYCVEGLAKMIAPVLCHTAEDIWQFLPYEKTTKSVFQGGWVQLYPEWHQPDLALIWKEVLELRSQVNILLESARNAKLIGASLEAKVMIYPKNSELFAKIEHLKTDLRYIFIVSQVEWLDQTATAEFQADLPNYYLAVAHADGEKCLRCWNYAPINHEQGICDRCVSALAGQF
ncbi:MAG: isoleucine--tRNA ligase [Pseudanabaenaceae cyanobacterium]